MSQREDDHEQLMKECRRLMAENERLRKELEAVNTELDEDAIGSGRHLALLIQERQKTNELQAEIDRLRAQHEADDKRLIDAAKGVQRRLALVAQLRRLTECDLESIDWDERTITLRYPADMDGLEVHAGLKIKADLTPMQPTAETEPPASDQTYIL